MKLLAALMLCAAVALVPACRHDPSEPGLVVGNGTVLGAQAECSSWYLRTDSGLLYETRGLPADFQQPGLRVHFTLRERSDFVSICMRGSIAEVISITRL
jgi:hypothetical protein